MGNGLNFLIYGIIAAALIIIGIFQSRSKEPVGFFGNSAPPSPKELTNVSAYNKEHGIMWILYGIAVGIAGFIGTLIDNKWVITILIFAVICAGVGIMNLRHAKIREKYTKEKKGK